MWVAIESLFRANKDSRAIYLLNEFHFMVQGDSTIFEYSQHLKNKVAALRDIGHNIEDLQLVFALLRGLNPQFSNTADDIANTIVLLDFSKTYYIITLKEGPEKTAAKTALLTTSRSGCTSLSGCRSSTLHFGGGVGSCNKDSGGGKGKGKGGERRRQRWLLGWRRHPCVERPLPPHGAMDLLQPMGSPRRRRQPSPTARLRVAPGRPIGCCSIGQHRLCPVQMSPLASSWDQAGLITVLHHMAL